MSKTFWHATDVSFNNLNLHSKHGNIFWKHVQLTAKYTNKNMDHHKLTQLHAQ
jgi:hypothetical protein